MKQNAYVAGVGMTPFGNAMGTTLSDLAGAFGSELSGALTEDD